MESQPEDQAASWVASCWLARHERRHSDTCLDFSFGFSVCARPSLGPRSCGKFLDIGPSLPRVRVVGERAQEPLSAPKRHRNGCCARAGSHLEGSRLFGWQLNCFFRCPGSQRSLQQRKPLSVRPHPATGHHLPDPGEKAQPTGT